MYSCMESILCSPQKVSIITTLVEDDHHEKTGKA